jgi:glycosyltransferase involved in cell wall biosynthesis
MHYLLIGLPTKQAEYQQIARALGVEDYVHFLGRVDQEQLPYYLAASDVFVMTSRHDRHGSFEGYGIAVVEAALCGTPAVVAENSGLAEAVDHEQTGLVVASEDPAAVSVAIIRLLQDDPLLQRLSQQAQQRGRTQTWMHQAQYYHHALKTILVG